MNGLSLLVALALAIGVFVAYRYGVLRGKRSAPTVPFASLRPAATHAPASVSPPQVAVDPGMTATAVAVDAERARLIRALEAENALLRHAAAGNAAERMQLRTFAEDRRQLFQELAESRADAARYRDIVVDLENNAMPPLLDGANMIDNLKLIVGVGPVLERMLLRLGITTYRQIARWSERDIDEFDAKLPEFPGRIRRDGWVTQARSLHQSKFGEVLAPR